MSRWLNYTNGDYLIFFNGEYDKIISRTICSFATRYPLSQKSSPNNVKPLLENFRNFGSVRAKVQRNKAVVNNGNMEIEILGYFAVFPKIFRS